MVWYSALVGPLSGASLLYAADGIPLSVRSQLESTCAACHDEGPNIGGFESDVKTELGGAPPFLFALLLNHNAGLNLEIWQVDRGWYCCIKWCLHTKFAVQAGHLW